MNSFFVRRHGKIYGKGGMITHLHLVADESGEYACF